MLSSVSSSMPLPVVASVLETQILHASMLIKVIADVLMMISPNVCSVSLMKCVGIVYSHPIRQSSLIKLSLVIINLLNFPVIWASYNELVVHFITLLTRIYAIGKQCKLKLDRKRRFILPTHCNRHESWFLNFKTVVNN